MQEADRPVDVAFIHQLRRQAASADPQGQKARRRLAELAEDRTLPKEVRRAARLALFQLGAALGAPARPAGGPGQGTVAAAGKRPGMPAAQVVGAVAGPLMGDGQLPVGIAAMTAGSGTVLVRAVLSDRRGIVELQVEELSRRAVQEWLEQARRSVGLPLEEGQARACWAGALAVARRAGSGLPVEFFTYRDLLEGLAQPVAAAEERAAQGAPGAAGEPDGGGHPQPGLFSWCRGGWPAALLELAGDEGRVELLARASGSLAAHPELGRWRLPEEVLRPHRAQLERLARSPLALPAAAAHARREHQVAQVAGELSRPPWAELLAGRLAYLALRLSHLEGVGPAARQAAACALVLEAAARAGGQDPQGPAGVVPGVVAELARRELQPAGAGPGGAGGPARGPVPARPAAPGGPRLRRTPSGLIVP
ncbi:MAG TPA: hypothetical protein VIL11_02855 [Limnochordales bacterium]